MTTAHTPDTAPADSLAWPLRQAADYLAEHGWHQHGLYADGSTTSPAASLVGALAIVCYCYPNPAPFGILDNPEADPSAYVSFLVAVALLADFIGAHDAVDEHGAPAVYTLDDWNDEPHQSAACVIATLRAAAAEYDRGWFA